MGRTPFSLKILFASFLFLTACYGRPKTNTSHMNATALLSAVGAQPGQATVVTFSALWCHPCREEIDSLNQANSEFAGVIQFRGLLVEGEDKGSPVNQGDINLFTSFTGEHAQYSVKTDPLWQLFDTLHAAQGHALPTMVLINAAGQVEEVVQQSLDYNTQLRPLLQALAIGQAGPIDTNPIPPVQPGQISDTVANWEARAEVAASATLLANVKASWQAGLAKFTFTESEMPFEAGKISFLFDGTTNTPRTAAWVSDTPVSYCTLNLVFKADGSLASSNGNCRQKH